MPKEECTGEFGPFSSGQPVWVENISLVLGRLFALTSVVLVAIWANSSDTESKFLGGLDWGEHVFNWHPVLMVTGVLCFTGWSITAYRNKVLGYTTSRHLHIFFHLCAKLCLTVGIRAVWESKDKDKNVHVYSLHAWLGLTTTLLLFQNDILGGITFLLPYIASPIKKIYTPYHIFFGKIAFLLAVVTIETGIMEKNVFLDCMPDLHGKEDTAPGSHYNEIPAGCRVSNGLGITVMLSMLFLLFALRNKKLTIRKIKKPPVTAQNKLSFMGTLLSPLYGSNRADKETEDDGADSFSVEESNCASVRTRQSLTSNDEMRVRASSIA